MINFDYYNYKYIKRMEYQKIINVIGSTNNQSSKLRTKHLVEVNDESRGQNNKSGEITIMGLQQLPEQEQMQPQDS